MMVSDFIVEHPNFKYPRQELFNFQNNNPAYKENQHFQKRYNLNTASSHKFFDLIKMENDVIKDLTKNLQCNDYKFTKVLAGGVMPKHIDPQRTGVLMLPLTDSPCPIVFYKNGKEVFSHVYTCPTMINAKIEHGVPEVNNDRIFFQINFLQSWETLKEMRFE